MSVACISGHGLIFIGTIRKPPEGCELEAAGEVLQKNTLTSNVRFERLVI
jgi:hypothetical protein